VDDALVDLWNKETGAVIGSTFSFAANGAEYVLSLVAPDENMTLSAAGTDYFDGLQHVRRELEAGSWYPLCNGARVDCYPSGMARDMGMGLSVYVLSVKPGLRRRLPVIATFEVAPKDLVGTVADQDRYFRAWLESRAR
jgi:hypothetical protein